MTVHNMKIYIHYNASTELLLSTVENKLQYITGVEICSKHFSTVSIFLLGAVSGCQMGDQA